MNMTMTIDARGRSCPEPVLMTRNALASKDKSYEVLVDNPTAVQNVTRFARKSGYDISVAEQAGTYRLTLTRR